MLALLGGSGMGDTVLRRYSPVNGSVRRDSYGDTRSMCIMAFSLSSGWGGRCKVPPLILVRENGCDHSATHNERLEASSMINIRCGS